MIDEKLLEDFETIVDRTNNNHCIWKVKNIYSEISGEPQAYYKDLNAIDPMWKKEAVLIKPDGQRNTILKNLINNIEQMRKNQYAESTKESQNEYSSGKSVFSLLLDNRHKKILSDNNIKITPYIRNLIEQDLAQRGLL